MAVGRNGRSRQAGGSGYFLQMIKVFKDALRDLHNGLKMHRVWIALASENIGDQHRHTMLGPIWLLVNYLAFATAFIFIFNAATRVFPITPPTLPRVSWSGSTMMDVISQSVSLMSHEESLIKGTTLPLSVYFMRLTMQSIIRAGYTLVACLAIVIFAQTPVTYAWLYSVLGIALILAVTPAVVIIFSFVGVYFPDSRYIVSNAMRVGMFFAPVFWTHKNGTDSLRNSLYCWNPFTYFIEIVREPILLGGAPIMGFLVCFITGVLCWTLALTLLGLLRKQIVFIL